MTNRYDLRRRGGKRTGRLLAAFAVTVAMLTAAACSSTGTGDDSAETPGGGVVTFAFSGPPLSGMSPAKSGGGTSSIYYMPAYDPLIWLGPDGEYKPALALEWGYVDQTNTVLELKLREGVEFTDGEAFNAEAVKAYMDYFVGAGGHLAPKASALESVEVVDDYVVRLHLNEPNPVFIDELNQHSGLGMIASPAAVANPASLDNATAGTGAYIYDPDQSTIDDTYTYVRNEEYWNPDAAKFDEIVVKVISDRNAMLSAVRSGQLDVGLGTGETVAVAEASGIEVLKATGSTQVYILGDRAGALAPELGDVRVRQAINYAIDSEAITKVTYPDGTSGSPATSLLGEGDEGYESDAATYPYDPDKARELLEEAGYANGITIDAACRASDPSECLALEAMTSQLSDVGIELKINALTTTNAYDETVAGAKAPTFMGGFSRPTYRGFESLMTGRTSNPFGTEDATAVSLMDKAAAAVDDQERASVYAELNDHFMDEAWTVPLTRESNIILVGDRISGAYLEEGNPQWSPFSPDPELAWGPASK